MSTAADTRIAAQVVALKRGLYSLKSFTALLGTVKLKIKPFIPESMSSKIPTPEAHSAVPSLGTCDLSGKFLTLCPCLGW